MLQRVVCTFGQQRENRLDLTGHASLWATYIATTVASTCHHLRLRPTSLKLTAATPPFDMPSPSVTRAASRSVNNHASRHWLPAQMAAALHRMVQLRSTVRGAVEFVNELSDDYKPHALSRSPLHDMFTSLPSSLRHLATSSEGQLLQHIHCLQAGQRAGRTVGQTMLTTVAHMVSEFQFGSLRDRSTDVYRKMMTRGLHRP